MQSRRISPEQAEQMPKKKKTGREREQELVGHLRGEPGRIVGCRLPQQPARRPPNEPERVHFAQVYFAARNYPLNSPRPIPT